MPKKSFFFLLYSKENIAMKTGGDEKKSPQTFPFFQLYSLCFK